MASKGREEALEEEEDEEEEEGAEEEAEDEMTVRGKIPLLGFCANLTISLTLLVLAILTKSPSSSLYFTITSPTNKALSFLVNDSKVSSMCNDSLHTSSP